MVGTIVPCDAAIQVAAPRHSLHKEAAFGVLIRRPSAHRRRRRPDGHGRRQRPRGPSGSTGRPPPTHHSELGWDLPPSWLSSCDMVPPSGEPRLESRLVSEFRVCSGGDRGRRLLLGVLWPVGCVCVYGEDDQRRRSPPRRPPGLDAVAKLQPSAFDPALQLLPKRSKAQPKRTSKAKSRVKPKSKRGKGRTRPLMRPKRLWCWRFPARHNRLSLYMAKVWQPALYAHIHTWHAEPPCGLHRECS